MNTEIEMDDVDTLPITDKIKKDSKEYGVMDTIKSYITHANFICLCLVIIIIYLTYGVIKIHTLSETMENSLTDFNEVTLRFGLTLIEVEKSVHFITLKSLGLINNTNTTINTLNELLRDIDMKVKTFN